MVAFDHPATGRREQLEPSSFGRDTFERGDPIELAYDRRGDRTLVVSKRPLPDTRRTGTDDVSDIGCTYRVPS